MAQGFIRKNWLFRAWENIETDIRMEVKGWTTYLLILGIPLWSALLLYFVQKYLELRSLKLQRIDVTNLSYLDASIFPYIIIGCLLTLLLQYMFGEKILTYVHTENKRIISDEYIRGAKLVCVEEFNKQFQDAGEMLEIQIVVEKCEREF